MVLAIPAGWLADVFRRDYICRLSALVGIAAGASMGVFLFYKLPLWFLFIVMGLLVRSA